MYSLKKTILNILIIGIAAAGVATADDTSASSVSLSLSLANVVPSNKAGKQTKAGKQVKAVVVVGKAVKAKAIKYDSSLSQSMSMSYGPDEADSSPDYNAGLQTFPPDPVSNRAQLIFPVVAFRNAYISQYPNYSFDFLFTVLIAGITQQLTIILLENAGDRAAKRGDNPRIESSDINFAVKYDEELYKVLGGDRYDIDHLISTAILNNGVYKVFKQQNYPARISEDSMNHLRDIVTVTVQNIVGAAIKLADLNDTRLLTDEFAQLGYYEWVNSVSVSVSPDGYLAIALHYGQTAAALYAASF